MIEQVEDLSERDWWLLTEAVEKELKRWRRRGPIPEIMADWERLEAYCMARAKRLRRPQP